MLYCYKTAPNVVAIGACERTECDIKYEIVDSMPVADPEQALRDAWKYFEAERVRGGYTTSPEAICRYFDALQALPVQLTPIKELKARSETAWLSTLNLTEANAPGMCLCNIKADLAQCKTTMSPEDYTACLEYALYDYIPNRVIGTK